LKTEILRRRVEKYFRAFGRPDGVEMSDLLSDLDPTLTLHELEGELKARGIDLSRMGKRVPEEFGIVTSHMNPYGYIYLPKGFRVRLPFGPGERLTIETLDDILVIYKVRNA